MARTPAPRIEQARAMYLAGRKLIEIAKDLDLPGGKFGAGRIDIGW